MSKYDPKNERIKRYNDSRSQVRLRREEVPTGGAPKIVLRIHPSLVKVGNV